MRIYVASSWRNEHQQAIVKRFRDEGHEVYDFRNPLPGQHGFSWKETSAVPPEQWTVDDFNAALVTDPARRGFGLDMAALIWCDVCVCVLPCGKDAHLEAGWAAGAGKKTAILLLDFEEPLVRGNWLGGSKRETLPGFLAMAWEQRGRPTRIDGLEGFYENVAEDRLPVRRGWEPGLMYKMCDLITGSLDAVSNWLRVLDGAKCVSPSGVSYTFEVDP